MSTQKNEPDTKSNFIAPDSVPPRKPFKLNVSKEWYEENAGKEIGHEIGAGCPDITPPTDTTGSGREGETAKQRTEQDEVLWQSFLKAFIAEFPSKPIYDTDSCRYYVRFAAIFAERRLAAALAQVEALRRDGERLDWLEKNITNFECASGATDFAIIIPKWRDNEHGPKFYHSTLRAAIDSAQRQEGM